VLAGWAVVEPLGRLASGPVGETARAWFDELRLRAAVAGGFVDAGLENPAARAASERIRTLLTLPRPSNVGGRTTADRARRLVEAWLAHPELRTFLRVNAWEDTEWFGREEWRELLDWALLLDRIDGAPDAWPVISKLAIGADEAGYRVDRLRELLAPAPRARRAAAARSPRREPAAPDPRPSPRKRSSPKTPDPLP
jgi:hypothetical protein